MQIVNLQITPTGVKPVIHVSQYDVERQFQIKLWDGQVAYNPPSGATIEIQGIKPDQHGFAYSDCVSVSGNTLTVTTKKQMTILEGKTECEIRISKNNQNLGTLNFDLMVEESPVNENTDISETELPAIFALATEQMENAEAWAKGTKNGVPVGSSAPQYNNHSKHFSEEAEAHADDSEAYAKGTRDGVDVGSSDVAYHNNSKYYSEQANAEATNSANSAVLSRSWAEGGTNTRAGEDTNNSKYWSQESNRLGQYWNEQTLLTGQTWAREAEAWAKGTRNEVPVIQGDDTYENNSKYYSQLSATAYQNCLEALTQLNGYFNIIKLFLGTVYLQTEVGDNLITESGDKIVIDY